MQAKQTEIKAAHSIRYATGRLSALRMSTATSCKLLCTLLANAIKRTAPHRLDYRFLKYVRKYFPSKVWFMAKINTPLGLTTSPHLFHCVNSSLTPCC